MQEPPLLPAKKLPKVLTVARVDGWAVITVAGVSMVWAVGHHDFSAAGFAAGAVLAGFAELLGRRCLLRGEARGRNWLITAQLSLLALVWFYLGYSWNHFDPEALWATLPGFYQKMMLTRLHEQGLDPEIDRLFLLQLSHRITCVVVSVVVVFYQGGLARYYHRHARLASPAPGR